MARDYRHGYGHHHKQSFQRKSQAQVGQTTSRRPTVAMIWASGFLLSLVLLVGLFVSQHFASKGVKSASSDNDKTIFSTQSASKSQNENADVMRLDEAENQKQTANAQVGSDELTPADTVNETAPDKDLVEPSQKQNNVAATSSSAQGTSKIVVNAIEPKTNQKEANEPTHYSFYTGLGKMKLVVDAKPLPVALEKPHYIQAGSFGSKKIAQRELARLQQNGVAKDLTLAEYKGSKQVYYRLLMGPFSNRLILNKRRNELRRYGVDTLLMKTD